MHSKLIKILSGIVVMLVILLLVFKYKNSNNVTTDTNSQVSKASACGIEIVSPEVGDNIDHSFVVHAIVDNTKRVELGCGWTVFEGQAGLVHIYDKRGLSVGSNLLTTTEDWMTQGPVNFYSEIHIDIDPADKNLILVIEEDDPSGIATRDTVSFPLILK